eukprot:12394058-Prorocentrum_lima.AAC.1
MQTGAKASNVEFLNALERNWTMSKPRHLGPADRCEKLQVAGVMISRQPTTIQDMDEGTYFFGQGHYTLEVLEK